MLKIITTGVDIIVWISPVPIIHKVGWTPHLVRALCTAGNTKPGPQSLSQQSLLMVTAQLMLLSGTWTVNKMEFNSRMILLGFHYRKTKHLYLKIIQQ
jgi:hypothetical protein